MTRTPERRPGEWIWLLILLPPGGIYLWGDWLGAHEPGWVNWIFALGGLTASGWVGYRLQWPNGYRNRRRHVAKHQATKDT